MTFWAFQRIYLVTQGTLSQSRSLRQPQVERLSGDQILSVVRGVVSAGRHCIQVLTANRSRVRSQNGGSLQRLSCAPSRRMEISESGNYFWESNCVNVKPEMHFFAQDSYSGRTRKGVTQYGREGRFQDRRRRAGRCLKTQFH